MRKESRMYSSDKSATQGFRDVLARGEIPLGDFILPVEENRNRILEVLAHHVEGKPKEWSVENHRWNRDKLLIDILWYPKQSVFLTFNNGDLYLIEFSCPGGFNSKWDYSLEVRKYFHVKTEAVKHLGGESRSNESNDKNLEAVWEFAKLIFYIACDARTGGCGIGLRAKLKNA
jgi:hypothetical protein